MRLTAGSMLDPRLKSLLHTMRINILPILKGSIERQLLGMVRDSRQDLKGIVGSCNRKGGVRLKAGQHPAASCRAALTGSFLGCKGQSA